MHEPVAGLTDLGLTPTQAETYYYLLSILLATGSQPSQQEIAARFGIGQPSVIWRLAALRKKGWIKAGKPTGKHGGNRFMRDFDGRPIKGFKFDYGE